VNRPITARAVHDSEPLRSGFGQLGYEVIPFKRTREAVLAHVPRQVPLTVTASPAKGQDTTIDLAVQLAGDGYSVAPHLSARQVTDRAHLACIVARCREAGITGVFVIGGDQTGTPTEFRDARDLLTALHELGHPRRPLALRRPRRPRRQHHRRLVSSSRMTAGITRGRGRRARSAPPARGRAR
jgi:methylenetetrahydrofolate reductase (NADPH)